MIDTLYQSLRERGLPSGYHGKGRFWCHDSAEVSPIIREDIIKDSMDRNMDRAQLDIVRLNIRIILRENCQTGLCFTCLAAKV